VRHRQPPGHDLVADDVDQEAAVALVLPPAAGLVGVPQRRDVADAAVDDAHPIEVAAVAGRQARDELRPPAGHEAVAVAAGAEAGELGVDEPQFLLDPGHLVDLHVAGGVHGARDEAGVVRPGRRELGGQGGHVVVLEDLQVGADGQAAAAVGQAHRPAEDAEVGVEHAVLGAEDDELAAW
jgi:hypothetical protein